MQLSTSQICRILKTNMGETFITLLNKIRIQQAIKLMKKGKYKVYEIAELVGYNNYAYFYKLFKNETGTSPTDFYKG